MPWSHIVWGHLGSREDTENFLYSYENIKERNVLILQKSVRFLPDKVIIQNHYVISDL